MLSCSKQLDCRITSCLVLIISHLSKEHFERACSILGKSSMFNKSKWYLFLVEYFRKAYWPKCFLQDAVLGFSRLKDRHTQKLMKIVSLAPVIKYCSSPYMKFAHLSRTCLQHTSWWMLTANIQTRPVYNKNLLLVRLRYQMEGKPILFPLIIFRITTLAGLTFP